MAATDRRRSEISLRADELKAEADALFKGWNDSAAAISDADPSAAASLKPNAAKLNDEAKDLVKRIDDTITTANTAIGALRPWSARRTRRAGLCWPVDRGDKLTASLGEWRGPPDSRSPASPRNRHRST